MLIKCSVDTLECENISNSVSLVPRLEYSINLLDEIIEILKIKRYDLKKSNQDSVSDFNDTDDVFLKSIELEKIMIFSLEILSQIQKRIGSISDVYSIPEILPSSIPMIRIVSAQLFEIVPYCSQKLSELSVHLGSIVLDSAVLTKARFDFSQLNEEFLILLDEVKLMVDSKINKQYPNLNFFKLCNT